MRKYYQLFIFLIFCIGLLLSQICTKEDKIDYFGNDFLYKGALNRDACCALCTNMTECKGYTFVAGENVCYFKKSACKKSSCSYCYSGLVIDRVNCTTTTTSTAATTTPSTATTTTPATKTP